MAARLEPAPAVRTPDLVDLRKVSSAHLDTLLEEETREWNEALDWDFRKSADLVRRFVDLRALSGCALMDQGEAVGYSYFVLEDQKGLIGDLYVRPRYRTAENENRLLYAVLEGLVTGSQVRRIESQLMMILPETARDVPGTDFLATYERNFMLLDFDAVPLLPDRPARHRIHIEKWSDHHQDNAAQLIAASLALIPVSLTPTVIGGAGHVYFVVAGALSSGFFYYSSRLAFLRSNAAARRLLTASIICLPLVFLLMVLDKL